MIQLPGIDYACPTSSSAEIDLVYDTVDDLLLTGKFDTVDDLLARVDVDTISISLMLSYLTITVMAKSKLKNRANFYNRVFQYLTVVDPTRCDALVQGLQ